MTRQNWTIGLVAAAFAVSLAPVLSAQDTRGGQAAGSRPSNGSTTGSAAPRGGDSGSGSAGGSSSSSSSGSGSSSSGMGSSGSSGMSGYSPARERAPERPSPGERRDSGQRATPRGSAAASGDNPRGSGATTSSAYYGDGSGRSLAPVPAYSRPRDGRTVTGTPGERTAQIPGGPGSGGYYPIYDPYYYYGHGGYYGSYYGYCDPVSGYGCRYSGYWMPGYGYGFGYFGFDPSLFGGYSDPYSSGYGQSSGGYGTGHYQGVGSLRLKVKPVNAQVYIDGYYVGVIDSFDGMFQKLEIEAGSHRVEVRAEGFETVAFDVMVPPGETVIYKGELPRIR